MTPFTNRDGAVDYYDETVVQIVEQEAHRFVKMNRKVPYTIGVSAEQLKELKKAEKAGVKPTITFKDRVFVIAVHVSTGAYRYPMFRTNHEERERRGL